MTIDQFIRLFSALLTPLIAFITVYIAYQQWLVNRQKLRLELYDRRLRIYEEIKKIISIITRDAKPTTDDLLKFRISVSEADFLFDSDIPEYIDEIYKRGLNLWRCHEEYRDITMPETENYDHKKVVSEMTEELEWLVHQYEPAKLKFKKYLSMSD